MIHVTPLGVPILTWEGVRWLALFLVLFGWSFSTLRAFVSYWLNNSKRAIAKRAQEVSEEARQEINRLWRLVGEGREREAELRKENASLRRLSQERIQSDRYHDSRLKAAMTGRPQ